MSTGRAVDRSVHKTALAVLALCTAINLVSRGVGESFAVFLLPLTVDFHADRASMTGIYSVYMLALGLSAPVIGALFDRLGPRVVYCTGLTSFGLAYLVAGSAQALWQLYVGLGLLAGIGASALGITPSSALVSRWFGQRLPRAMGVLYAALGIGVLILAPTTQWLIAWSGWRHAYLTIGAGLLLLLPLLLFAPWRRLASGNPQFQAARARPRTPRSQWNLRLAFKSPAFWGLFAVFFVTAVSTFTINVQAVAYLVEVGFSALQAATIFGTAGVMSIFGMMGAGMLSERYSERHVATVSYSCTILGIAALALLQWHASYAIALLFIVLFGTMQGSRGPLIATAAARMYSGAGLGSIYGGLALAMGLGAAVGSWSAGLLHDLTGGYGAGFLLGAFGAAAGIALFRAVSNKPEMRR